MLESGASTMVSWLGTYLAHSTVLVGSVWAFCRYFPLDALTRSTLWKISLVGGLFTATLQTGLGYEPLLGNVAVETGADTATVAAAEPTTVAEAGEFAACVGCDGPVILVESGELTAVIAPGFVALDGPHGTRVVRIAEPVFEPLALPTLAAAPPVLSMPPPEPGGAPSGGSAAPLALAGLFLAGAAASLIRLGFTARRLRRALRGRRALTAGPLRERFARLLARARLREGQVRLTMSPGLGSPLALVGGEIVVPDRAAALGPQQQEAMLAHELAHVLRRDPAWQVLASALEAVLWFQPLNRLARRGIQEAAEELCDDWAVRQTGSGVHLARCLAEVAEWPGREDMSHKFASPMAGARGSLLLRRVRRLLDERERERGRGARRWRGLLGAGLLACVGLGAPAISLSTAHASGPPPEAREAPTPPARPGMVAPPAPPNPPGMMAPPAPPAPPNPPGMMAPPAPPAPPASVLARTPSGRVSPVQGPAAPVLSMAPPMPPTPPAPVLAMAPGDVRVVIDAPPERLTVKQRRLLRRAERLDRRAGKLRARSGAPIEIVITGGAGASPILRVGPGQTIDVAQLRALAEKLGDLGDLGDLEELKELEGLGEEIEREVAEAMRELAEPDEETAREVGHGRVLDAEELRRIREEAMRAAEEAKRHVPSAEELRRIQEEARRAAEEAKRYVPSAEELRRIQEEARRAADEAKKRARETPRASEKK